MPWLALAADFPLNWEGLLVFGDFLRERRDLYLAGDVLRPAGSTARFELEPGDGSERSS